MINILLAIICMCGGATGPFQPAVRMNNPVQLEAPPPPPPPIPTIPAWSSADSGAKCVGAIPLLQYFSPGWDVNRMAGIMFRESRCQPGASNSCCSGLLQMHRMHVGSLGHCGVYSRNDLYDPVKNICAAAWLWSQPSGGYSAWSTS